MSSRYRRILLLCGLVPTLTAAVLSITRPASLSNLEYSVYDTLVRWTPTRLPSGKVVIVDVDEKSLASVGQWPWRRDVISRLIDVLRDRGAATVALDIMFAESERYEGSGRSPDAVLSESIRRGGVILGYGLLFEPTHEAPRPCVQHAVGLPIVRNPTVHTDDPFFRATSAVCNIATLTTAATASGFLNAAPDPDGILRRAPLLMQYGDRVYPALSLAAVRSVTDARNLVLRIANVNTSSLALDGQDVPLDGKSNLLLRYRGGRRTFPYVSAVDVLNGKVPPEQFTDRIVFVGTTALGTREVVATPLDTLFVGVEVQATVADNLLQRDFMYRPEHGVALETQAVIGLGTITALVVARFGLVWGAIAAISFVFAAWTGSRSLLATDGAYFSPLYPSIALLSALAAMTFAAFAVERRRAEHAGQETAKSHRLMVQTLLSLTGIRDLETGRHSKRTQKYARVIAEELSKNPSYREYLTQERIELLASLAPLHDIGKVGVPDRVLNKPGQLTPEELTEMRRHPRYGRDVIENAERAAGVKDDVALSIAKDIVYTHHEWWDGSGYPEGLSGTAIPIPGRVMAVVDVYDAIITRRLYQAPMSNDEAVAHIVRSRGTHFDPAVVDAFVNVAPRLHALSQEPEG
jgi:HD-GYP domain-containing protein (c-di-GMP phosphodiesterase class II)